MITLEGQPKSTNTLYKSHCRFGYPTVYMTAVGKQLKKDYKWQAKSQWHKQPLKINLAVNIIYYLKTKGKFDLDNANKLVLDSLSGIVYEDDNQITELHLFKEYDKKTISSN